MSIIASCGHMLTEEEHLGAIISVKYYSRDGGKAICYPALCNRCLKRHIENSLDLITEEERNDWLKK